MKAFIIFRDRVTYARQCAAALAVAGLDVCIVDHGSTWPEAVNWLAEMKSSGLLVLQRVGGHPQGLWTWKPFREACGNDERYIVTDPDVVPSEDCPAGWVAHLNEVLDRYNYPKAGLGLRIDRIPEHYPRREKVLSWEGQFWDRPLDGDSDVYDAIIDTTLALYRPLGERAAFSVTALRTGPPYVADHLAWYEDFGDLPAELRYYHEHAESGISYWAPSGRSAWGD